MMKQYTDKQIQDTLKIVDSSIAGCEKVKLKLKEGSPQLSLNTNRLKALYLSKAFLEEKKQNYTSDEIERAVIQITSIKDKSTTGIKNAKEGTGTYTRFCRIIQAMDIVLDYLQCGYSSVLE
ncbi:MAG: hypothetical protein PHR92_08355 [Lachnospiraceae bacterium]|nr:hypothetical protein [Lachnospiraceae bacterium]